MKVESNDDFMVCCAEMFPRCHNQSFGSGRAVRRSECKCEMARAKNGMVDGAPLGLFSPDLTNHS